MGKGWSRGLNRWSSEGRNLWLLGQRAHQSEICLPIFLLEAWKFPSLWIWPCRLLVDLRCIFIFVFGSSQWQVGTRLPVTVWCLNRSKGAGWIQTRLLKIGVDGVPLSRPRVRERWKDILPCVLPSARTWRWFWLMKRQTATQPPILKVQQRWLKPV